MSARVLLALAAMASLASPLAAQSYNPPAIEPRAAMGATADRFWQRHCADPANQQLTFCQMDPATRAANIKTRLQNGEKSCRDLFGTSGGFFEAIAACWNLYTHPIFRDARGFPSGGGEGGGGGASGEWEQHKKTCNDFEILKVANRWRVPSLPLVPGGPMQASSVAPAPVTYIGKHVDNSGIRTSNPDAGALWKAHKVGMGRTGEGAQPYYGAWRRYNASGNTYYEYSTKHWIDNGYVYTGSMTVYTASPNTAFSLSNNYESCPADQAGGIGFDFYYEGNYASPGQCIWFGQSSTPDTYQGYAYSDVVDLTKTQFEQWMTGTSAGMYGCEVSRAGLLDMVKTFWDKTTPDPDFTPEDQDVSDCNSSGFPNVQGMQAARPLNATQYECGTPSTPPPDPDPAPDPDDPTDPGGGGGGDGAPDGWYDPAPDQGLSFPDWSIEMPDWFQLPTLDFSGATCPVYQLDLNGFFGETFTLDSHCPLIEDFRAIIAAIMIAAWTLVAAIIVMKA